MAKENKKEDIVETSAEAAVPTSARELLWEKFLASYEAQNPAKFAARKAQGAFDKIPDSFGIVF